jgi:hypothetical protein
MIGIGNSVVVGQQIKTQRGQKNTTTTLEIAPGRHGIGTSDVRLPAFLVGADRRIAILRATDQVTLLEPDAGPQMQCGRIAGIDGQRFINLTL